MMSGFISWRAFAAACGWDAPDAKSPPPPPKQFLRNLGAMTDLKHFTKRAIELVSSDEEVQTTLGDLRHVFERGRLYLAFAGNLYGRMQGATATCFGRFGCAMLTSCSRRQHEPGRSKITPQIKAACEFRTRNLPIVRPREVQVNPPNLPLAISYSDGEGESAGVGVALWLPCGEVIAGYTQVPGRRGSPLMEQGIFFRLKPLGRY